MTEQGYFSSFGPGRGDLSYSKAPGTHGVLKSRDQLMPVGTAFCIAGDDQGRAVFRLQVHKVDLPGRWLCVDRRFVRLGDAAEVVRG